VAYLCGSSILALPGSEAELREMIRSKRADYIVYFEKDVEGDLAGAAALRTLGELDPPIRIAGPPGAWTIYVQALR
jgi:hypothetical protein